MCPPKLRRSGYDKDREGRREILRKGLNLVERRSEKRRDGTPKERASKGYASFQRCPDTKVVVRGTPVCPDDDGEVNER